MPAAAGFKDFSLADSEKRFLKSGDLLGQTRSALFQAGQVSDEDPDHRHPPGSVIVYKTADEKFILADDAAGDRNSAASVIALEAADDGWEGQDLTISGHWGSVTLALAASDDLNSEVITAVEADAFLAANITIAEDGGLLRVTNRQSGKGTWLKVIHENATAFGADGAEASGADADYRVTTHWADLKDLEGTAQDSNVPTISCGDFDTSELSHLTAEARAVLERNGSRFD